MLASLLTLRDIHVCSTGLYKLSQKRLWSWSDTSPWCSLSERARTLIYNSLLVTRLTPIFFFFFAKRNAGCQCCYLLKVSVDLTYFYFLISPLPICLTLKWLWKQRTGIVNNETEDWKFIKIDEWINCVRSRECRICRFRESNFQLFFLGEHAHAPGPPYIIRAFGADSTLVSAVTLDVLNVQLTAQKSCPLQKCVPKKL